MRGRAARPLSRKARTTALAFFFLETQTKIKTGGSSPMSNLSRSCGYPINEAHQPTRRHHKNCPGPMSRRTLGMAYAFHYRYSR